VQFWPGSKVLGAARVVFHVADRALTGFGSSEGFFAFLAYGLGVSSFTWGGDFFLLMVRLCVVWVLGQSEVVGWVRGWALG